MSLETLIAGRYHGAYNAVDVGLTDRGYEIQQESASQTINTSDAYGDSIIDLVQRGGNCHCQFVGKSYSSKTITPFWPWGALGVMQTVGGGSPAPLGRLASNVASPFVLSVVSGTPAGVAGAPNTLTASLAILAPNSPASLQFTTELRQVPIRLLFLPYETTVGGTTTTFWFQLT